jgi:hypothetical protein
MTGKKLLLLFIGIILFVAAYLYYIKIDRERSIERYFDEPRIGDVYKIKKDDEDGSSWLHYFKLVRIEGDNLIFNPSKMKANSSTDYLLHHFDNNSTVIYSKQDLLASRKGLWKNYKKYNTELVEIMRKD